MFRILYQDRHLRVIDKPAGLPTIPTRTDDDSVATRTGWRVCHRLDADTSGVLVLAVTAAGQRLVNDAFAARRVEKRYLAVCVGFPPGEAGEVDVPIGRWQRGRVAIGPKAADARPALTGWRVAWRDAGRVGIVAEPHTGRTHQVRAHLASIGLPLVGDEDYGGPPAGRVHLHAWQLVLPWPGPADQLRLEAAPPADLGWPG